MKLTKQQLAAVDALRQGPKAPPELAVALDTTPEGAAATASSLVRKGLVARQRERGHVRYELTPKGAS